MNNELTENVQDSIRPGEVVDTYYYGETNSEKQAYPCVVNNKFRQQFTNLAGGTSQFQISPYQGVSDVVLYFKMPAASQAITYTNATLPQSWGYSMIRQVSIRYGSSAQYFFTGSQIFMQNLFDCEDTVKRAALTTLGGAALVETDISGAEAYVYLNLPHCSPRANGKPLPLASDLLVQPIIITVELFSIADTTGGGVFKPQLSGGTPQTISGLPPQLSFAQLQVKQEMMADSADLLARRVDMNSHGYTYPLKYFPQQEVQINCGQGSIASGGVSVNLTGFRAGEVRNILLWLTRSDSEGIDGPLVWSPLTNVELTYNGEIFYHNDSDSGLLWNLISADTAPTISTVVQNSSGAFASAVPSYWTDINFAQVNMPYDKEVKLVHGKPILNAVVNLRFTTPSVLGSGESWTLHALYLYNSSLLFSRGSAEYIF
jgi:hypothetical protein